MNFILIDVLTLCASGYYFPRQILVSVLVGASKVRARHHFTVGSCPSNPILVPSSSSTSLLTFSTGCSNGATIHGLMR